MNIDWAALADILQSHQRFVLTTHVRPDADALGSQLGFAGLLEHLGKRVEIINASAVPPRLVFLDPQKRCKQLGTDVTEASVLDTDVHLILDTSSWAQLAEIGKLYKKTRALKVVIDHHASADDLGARDFKDVTAEATGSMVVDFAESQKWPITPFMAQDRKSVV